jgi:hypothetical protein
MRARRLGGCLVACTMALMAVAGREADAAPASQQTLQIQRVEAVSATDGDSSKSAVVDCPAGTRVYNAAGRINGGVGAVVLDDVTPNATLTSVLVTAYETSPDDSWSVIAYALCGSPVLNLQRISIASASNSLSPKTVTPTCPGPTRLYGLGAEITGALGAVVLDDLIPNAGLTGITVTAYETGAYAPNWTITGYAICGNAATTMQRVAVSNPVSPGLDPISPKAATTTACPPGTVLHGAGAELTGALGDVSLDEVIPSGALTDVIATGYAIAGFAGNWRIASYAICTS